MLSPRALTSSSGSGVASAPRLLEGLKATGVKAVAAGGSHFAVISQSGEVYVWGNGENGQLGLGHLVSQPSPRLLKLPQGRTVRQVRLVSRVKPSFFRFFGARPCLSFISDENEFLCRRLRSGRVRSEPFCMRLF